MVQPYQPYFDFLETSRYRHSTLQDTALIESLKNIASDKMWHAASNASSVFILDFSQSKYLAMTPSVESLSGYSSKYISDAGVQMIVERYHPQDGKVYFDNIFFRNIDFLREKQKRDSNYRFTYNYRFKTKRGEYKMFFQEMIVLQTTPDGSPLIVLISLTDISHFSSGTKIIHRIEDLNNGEQVYKYTHFLTEQASVLSKKEIEVLKWAVEGLNSKAIADKLHVSVYTVHNHRKNILEKTNSNNIADLLQYAKEYRLV